MKQKNKIGRNFLLWSLIVFVVISIAQVTVPNQNNGKLQKMTYSEFVTAVEKGDIKSVEIKGQSLSGQLGDEKTFESYAPEDAGLVPLLQKNNIQITAVPIDTGESGWFVNLLAWAPILLFAGLWIVMMKQMASSNGKAMSFGKSKAKLLEGKEKVTFDDVAGIEEAKQ